MKTRNLALATLAGAVLFSTALTAAEPVKVGFIYVARQADRHAASHILDHGGVVDDQLIAQRLCPSLLVLGPQGIDALSDRVELRRQFSP